MIGVGIRDLLFPRRTARVNRVGELATGRLHFDEAHVNAIAVADTAYNYALPVAGFNFIITTMLAFASKDVNDATATLIEIYTATSLTSTVVDTEILSFGMGKLTVLPLVPLNLLIPEGYWLNAKSSDAIINLSILGHYVKRLDELDG
jgi:hypothetical protein